MAIMAIPADISFVLDFIPKPSNDADQFLGTNRNAATKMPNETPNPISPFANSPHFMPLKLSIALESITKAVDNISILTLIPVIRLIALTTPVIFEDILVSNTNDPTSSENIRVIAPNESANLSESMYDITNMDAANIAIAFAIFNSVS